MRSTASNSAKGVGGSARGKASTRRNGRRWATTEVLKSSSVQGSRVSIDFFFIVTTHFAFKIISPSRFSDLKSVSTQRSRCFNFNRNPTQPQTHINLGSSRVDRCDHAKQGGHKASITIHRKPSSAGARPGIAAQHQEKTLPRSLLSRSRGGRRNSPNQKHISCGALDDSKRPSENNASSRPETTPNLIRQARPFLAAQPCICGQGRKASAITVSARYMAWQTLSEKFQDSCR